MVMDFICAVIIGVGVYNADGTIHFALGQLRFNFPNKFLVISTTQTKNILFANERRAESHGCMRVQDPVKYAEVLLSMVRPGDGYSQERIGRDEACKRDINLAVAKHSYCHGACHGTHLYLPSLVIEQILRNWVVAIG